MGCQVAGSSSGLNTSVGTDASPQSDSELDPQSTSCGDLPAWTQRSYSSGELVTVQSHAYRCNPGPDESLCGQLGYKPGVGASWARAWSDLGTCDDSSETGGCTPVTCASAAALCGELSDGCGGTLSCGTCSVGHSCNPTTHVCDADCVATTCEAQSSECGPTPDGCGGILACGTCGPGESCDEESSTCQADPDSTACGDDAHENNDDIDSSSLVASGSYEAVGCPTEDDYFAVELRAGDQLEINVAFVHRKGDIDLELLGPARDVLDESTGSENNERVTYTAVDRGRHHLRVYLADEGTVSYRMEVEVEKVDSDSASDSSTENESDSATVGDATSDSGDESTTGSGSSAESTSDTGSDTTSDSDDSSGSDSGTESESSEGTSSSSAGSTSSGSSSESGDETSSDTSAGSTDDTTSSSDETSTSDTETSTDSTTDSATETGTDPSDGIGALISRSQFDQMFPDRLAFYSYGEFVAAANAIDGFADSGDATRDTQELAAFLGQVAHETGHLRYIEEIEGPGNPYCDEQPWFCDCNHEVEYYGRGVIQLSWNYKYCLAGEYLELDLQNDPGLVARDSQVAWKTGLWFWMTQIGAGNWTCHDVMADGRGFGETTRTINGGLECNGKEPSKIQARANYYTDFSAILGVATIGPTGC